MLVITGDNRGLQSGDHVRVVHVVLTTMDVLQKAPAIYGR